MNCPGKNSTRKNRSLNNYSWMICLWEGRIEKMSKDKLSHKKWSLKEWSLEKIVSNRIFSGKNCLGQEFGQEELTSDHELSGGWSFVLPWWYVPGINVPKHNCPWKNCHCKIVSGKNCPWDKWVLNNWKISWRTVFGKNWARSLWLSLTRIESGGTVFEENCRKNIGENCLEKC